MNDLSQGGGTAAEARARLDRELEEGRLKPETGSASREVEARLRNLPKPYHSVPVRRRCRAALFLHEFLPGEGSTSSIPSS